MELKSENEKRELTITYRKYGIVDTVKCQFNFEPGLADVQDMMDLLVTGMKQ